VCSGYARARGNGVCSATSLTLSIRACERSVDDCCPSAHTGATLTERRTHLESLHTHLDYASARLRCGNLCVVNRRGCRRSIP
jgi:hypothetical protein